VPELALPDLHLPEAGLYLGIVMLFPREPGRHASLMLAAQNSAVRNILRRREPRAPIPRTFTPLVHAAATGLSFIDEAAKTAGHLVTPNYARPDIAALMLMYVLACADAPDEGEPATLEHARSIIGTAGKTRASLPGLGRSNLIDCWRDFAPAVHLTATRLFMRNLWEASAVNGMFKATFLAYAEALRLHGERHRPPRSRTTLLDPAEMWQVPPRFLLPEVTLKLPKPSEIRAQMARWGRERPATPTA
jgi:hypothetical protein